MSAERSFEEVLDRAFARARHALLAEHERQMKGAAGTVNQCLEVGVRTSVNTEISLEPRELSSSAPTPRTSRKSRDVAPLWRPGDSERSGVLQRRRSLSSANVKTLSAIIEAATQGVSRQEVRTMTVIERLRDTCRKGAWDSLMALVIVLNTVTIGLSTDVAPTWQGWFVVDSTFALIFLVEMLLKVCRKDGLHLYFLGPGWRWNIFELTLVVLALLEVAAGLGSGMGEAEADTRSYVVFRIFRLARIARILRMSRLEVFSDLIMMIHGALGGVRTFLWSVVLITLPLYSVALVLTDSFKDRVHETSAAEMFSNVGTSFFTIFRCMVGNDCTTADGRPIFVLVTQQYHWIFGAIYCLVMLVMTFGLFNVIVAIYVENIVAAAKFNDAHTKRQRLWDTEMFTEKITQMVDFLWRGDAPVAPNKGRRRMHLRRTEIFGESVCPAKEVSQLEISLDFFSDLRSHPEFQDILRDLDIADEDQLDLFDTLDVDGGGTIDLEELVTGIAKLRGDARRSDIVSVGLVLRSVQVSLQEFEGKVMRELKQHGDAITVLQRHGKSVHA